MILPGKNELKLSKEALCAMVATHLNIGKNIHAPQVQVTEAFFESYGTHVRFLITTDAAREKPAQD